MTKIKIVWYNVLRGFHKKESDGSFTFEKSRLESAKKIIAKLNPDIVFIGEGDFNPLCKIKGTKIKTIDYQKEFGFPFVYYSKPDETSRKGEVILSRIQFTTKNLSEGNYGTENFTDIRCYFKIDEKEICLDVVHPYPTITEEEKAKWIKKVLYDSNPDILLGDFNALSPEDKYKKEILFELFSQMNKDKEAVMKNVNGSLQNLMIKAVLEYGLIDTYNFKNETQVNTFPTKAYSPFEDKSIGIRLDYLFCSKKFHVIESGIIQNSLTDVASDHYPIYALLEI